MAFAQNVVVHGNRRIDTDTVCSYFTGNDVNKGVEDLRKTGLPRDKVLATAVQLLEKTLIRIGNEEYARENKSFGLTTLRNRHAAVHGDRLRLRFRGKSGKEHEVALDDPRVARVSFR